MDEFYIVVEKICRQDKRYKPDAYEFVIKGLGFTQKKLKKATHISGVELAGGLRDFAINQYGALAAKVLAHWGINQTQDFGNIVFNLIEKKLLAKTKEDSLSDFQEVYDFKLAFSDVLRESVLEGIRQKA